MEILIEESLPMEKQTARVSINGQMVKHMMGSGKMEAGMVMESGKASTMIPISENGRMARLMDMGSMYGLMVIGTKGNGKNA